MTHDHIKLCSMEEGAAAASAPASAPAAASAPALPVPAPAVIVVQDDIDDDDDDDASTVDVDNGDESTDDADMPALVADFIASRPRMVLDFIDPVVQAIAQSQALMSAGAVIPPPPPPARTSAVCVLASSNPRQQAPPCTVRRLPKYWHACTGNFNTCTGCHLIAEL